MDTMEKIIEYFKENEDELDACMEELDAWDNYLGDDRYYSMDELDEIYNGTDPVEILRRAFYGYDEDTYTTDAHGDKHYEAFCPNRDYFKFNGYGNLVSTDYKDYTGLLDKYFVKALQRNRPHIDALENSEELAALFDELDEE